jgi:hypothetical protein
MLSRGLIDQRLYEWAEELRFLRNAGAHHTGKVSREDAEDAIALTEAMLDYLYVLSARFEKFKARREEQLNESSGDP